MTTAVQKEALYVLIVVNPETGARVETDDVELTERELDAYLSNALEVSTDRNGRAIYRFADGWYSHICTNE